MLDHFCSRNTKIMFHTQEDEEPGSVFLMNSLLYCLMVIIIPTFRMLKFLGFASIYLHNKGVVTKLKNTRLINPC